MLLRSLVRMGGRGRLVVSQKKKAGKVLVAIGLSMIVLSIAASVFRGVPDRAAGADRCGRELLRGRDAARRVPAGGAAGVSLRVVGRSRWGSARCAARRADLRGERDRTGAVGEPVGDFVPGRVGARPGDSPLEPASVGAVEHISLAGGGLGSLRL